MMPRGIGTLEEYCETITLIKTKNLIVLAVILSFQTKGELHNE